MTRRLTRAEAMEFIEVWLNLSAAESDNENGSFQTYLAGVSEDDVQDMATQFILEASADIDPSSFTITTDHTESVPCVFITIKTEQANVQDA